MAASDLKVAHTVETSDGRQGIVRYIGPLHFAAGEWLGLELLESSGKNDGSVKGERYFTCQLGYGIFVRKETVTRVKNPVLSTASTTPNGVSAAVLPPTATKTRPSTAISADAARKRQSLMSTGSAGQTGSRLSMRSPTKPPTKTVNSAASSAISTPRTGTPATTARTSDSSTKSRTSVTTRPSHAPPSGTVRIKSNAARPSVGTAVSSRTARPSIASAKTTMNAARIPTNGQQASTQSRFSTKSRIQEPEALPRDVLKSPTINEENDSVNNFSDRQESSEGEGGQEPSSVGEETPTFVTSMPADTTHTTSTNRATDVGGVELRTAQLREMEELKAKLRTMEKQRLEDRERIQQVGTLQHERDRFENIIQALQKKLKTNQVEMADLRATCERATSNAVAVPEPSAELETELELATLDKEMAEERAENFQLELDTLKVKHEELELEVEILREENKELGSVMSPEEKASAGWLQMERERQRLREALVMLRDLSQQSENDLKNEIKELRGSLEEAETSATLYHQTADKLKRTEETNRHLMEQLEAAEANDEVFEAMESQQEQQSHAIEVLKKQIQDLEEHIQVTDELENFHIEEEKRLHVQLDDTEASLNETNRRTLEQDKVIEDLEYTLTKFRDVVQGLQSDIDELRRSREISEFEANEMSSKSRAMMDLNLRLQNSAAKTQAKTIDTELNMVRAKMASKHVEILNLFTMDFLDDGKQSIMALLCFGRLQAKSNLVSRLLGERLRERAYLIQGEENFKTFEVMERMQWIAGTCRRFEAFMSSCGPNEFNMYSSMLFELEPVERTVTSWLESLRRDELSTAGPETLQRMQQVLIDLAEKRITESTVTKATEVVVQMQMVENYADSAAGQINALVGMVQTKLGRPKDENDDSLMFDRKMDHLATRARTIKYLCGKVVQQLSDLLGKSLCLDEIYWQTCDEVEHQAEEIASWIRQIGVKFAEEFANVNPDDPLTYGNLTDKMMSFAHQIQQGDGSQKGAAGDGNIFAVLTARLVALQTLIDDLGSKASDPKCTIQYETSPTPWSVIARDSKMQKVVSPEVQEELASLSRRNKELGSRIVEREKTIEELSLRVEHAERRMKDSRARDDKEKAEKEEVDALRVEKANAGQLLEELRAELASHLAKSDADRLELEVLRKAAGAESLQLSSKSVLVDEQYTSQLKLEVNLLNTEIASLQAAVRFLREENNNLRIPVTETLIAAAKYTWLDSSLLASSRGTPRSAEPRTQLYRESTDIYSNLIDVAAKLQPIRLSSRRPALQERLAKSRNDDDKLTPASWQPISQTARYTVLKQREELEKWQAWKTDFVKRARVANNSSRTMTATSTTAISKTNHRNRQDRSIARNPPASDGSNLAITSADISLRKPNNPSDGGGVLEIVQN